MDRRRSVRCGGEFNQPPAQIKSKNNIERWQQIEIPEPQTITTEYQQTQGHCPCGHKPTGLKTYRPRGLNGLLELQHGGEKNLSLPESILAPLKEQLKNSHGFSDYKAIQSGLKTTYDRDIPL